MGQTILKPWQESIIAAVAKEPALAQFYLTGGTALAAYYFQHRLSEDLDFFVAEKPEPVFLHAFCDQLKALLQATSVRFERLYDRWQYYFDIGDEQCKVEFAFYPFSRLEDSLRRDGIAIDSLRDIAANKIMALLDRFDPKDFVDLYYLLQSRPLVDLRDDAQKKFGMTISNLFLGGELAKVRRIAALPNMLKPLSIEELKSFFSQQAKSLASKIF